ncbi:MAG: SPASM domain-containing protein [Crocinitomicaceae bacterium]|nr:SPASM domain-containing protein [Crocinitomicaceae bacterium]
MRKIRDAIHILKHLTFSRVWNMMLLYYSFWYSRWKKKDFHKGMPYALSIEPTTACNLGCPECPSGLKQFTRPTGRLKLETHDEILKQLSKHVFYINYYFQGEPFLNPQFLDLIKKAKTLNIYTATSTNAHFINNDKIAEDVVKSGLDRLIISIDGLTQKTYESYRVHGKLTKVIAGAKMMIEAKKRLKSQTPHLIFQFLAVQPNEHEIPGVFALGKEMGIDEVRIKTAQLYDYKNGNPLMPKNEKYARYKLQSDGTYALKWKTGNHCWRMWSSCVFTWDAKVVPCCFDKDALHQLGDLNKHDFNTIWHSKRYSGFRNTLFRNRNSIDICKNCSEGAKVWA